MATRPIELNEYRLLMELVCNGFEYLSEGKKRVFRPNRRLALIIKLQANLGLRISDILRLKVNSFKGNKMEITEKKTGKLQYREINPIISADIKDYAIEKQLSSDDYLVTITDKAVQKQLRILSKHMKLENISTHSFRKL